MKAGTRTTRSLLSARRTGVVPSSWASQTRGGPGGANVAFEGVGDGVDLPGDGAGQGCGA